MLRYLSLLLFSAALALPLTQSASAQVPYTGTETGSFTLVPNSPTTGQVTASANGSDSLGGAFSAAVTADLDFSNPMLQLVSNGVFTRDYGGGNSITGAFSGTLTPTGPTTGVFSLPFTITGGTGQFAGVTGSGLEEGSLTFTSPLTADFTSSFQGTVVPEPGTLALLFGLGTTGLLAARRMRRRAR